MATQYTLNFGFRWKATKLGVDDNTLVGLYPLQLGLSDQCDAAFYKFKSRQNSKLGNELEPGDRLTARIYDLGDSNAKPKRLEFTVTDHNGQDGKDVLAPHLSDIISFVKLPDEKSPAFGLGPYSCWTPEVDSEFVLHGEYELSARLTVELGEQEPIETKVYVVDPEMWVEGG